MHMKKFYFDIETIPAGDTSHDALRYLYDRKIAKKMKEKAMSEAVPINLFSVSVNVRIG